MGMDWDLSKYQIETAAHVLEAVWGAIQKQERAALGTMHLHDVNHFLRHMKGGYDGAGHLLLILKSEKTAKGQIAKMAELCKRVGSSKNFANEHKVALAGVAQFLQHVMVGSRFPREVQSLAKEASEVARRLMSNAESSTLSDKPSRSLPHGTHSSKLTLARYHHRILLVREKASSLPHHEREWAEHSLLKWGKKIKESKTIDVASSHYKEMVHSIVQYLGAVSSLSEQGKMFKQWLETQMAADRGFF